MDKKVVFTAIFVVLTSQLFSQNYPIQATVALLPPYSNQWTSYYSETGKIQLGLLHKDLITPNVEVFLRAKIEGPGISLETDFTYKSATSLALTAGVPLQLDGTDIAEIITPEHLQFQGISKAEFVRSGSVLPQGIYTISIRAFDFYQGQALSNWAAFTTEISGQLPPIINFPQDGSSVTAQNPQYLLIQFFPRHSVSPSLDNVHYRIRLVEILPSGRNANEVMQSTQVPFFETITGSTTFVYGAGEPQLISGRNYALQIQVIDVSGKTLFENDGFSQVHRFVYGSMCPTPIGLNAAINGRDALISWTRDSTHRSWLLEYRMKGERIWKSEIVFENSSLIQLDPVKEYVVHISGFCGEDYSQESQEIVIRADTSVSDYEKGKAQKCGNKLPEIDLQNKTPLAYLMAGDVIQAADFEVTVLAVEGASGIFSGSGTVTMPYTGKIPIPCYFENIGINSDKRLVSGKIQLLRRPLEWSNRTVSNLSKTWNSFYGKNWNNYERKKYSGRINSLEKRGDGTIEINGSAGTQVLNTGRNYQLEDDEGNIYYISEAGKVSRAEGRRLEPIVPDSKSGEGGPSKLTEGNAKAYFYAEAGQGYDAWEIRDNTAGKEYDQMECADTSYYAGWKLLRAGETDTVYTEIVQGKRVKISADSVYFLRSDGTELKCLHEGTIFRIPVTGRLNLYADAIWACYNEISSSAPAKRVIIGKLNLINVDTRKVHVALVPVNGLYQNGDIHELRTGLNALLKGHGLEYEVSVKAGLFVENYNAATEIIEADRNLLGTTYAASLNRFIKVLEERDPWVYDYSGWDTAYLFVLNKSTEEAYMALNRKYGFLFLNNSGSIKSHTVSHEVGHGLFALEHVFGSSVSTAGKSMNLMDYSYPFALLNHTQWIQIFDKERLATIRMHLSQKAAEGRMMQWTMYAPSDLGIPENGSLNFVAPDGKTITLSADSTQALSFSHSFVATGTSSLTKISGNANGTLTRIIYRDSTYGAYISGKKFKGYFINADPRLSRLDQASYYRNTGGQDVKTYGGFEDSNCRLIVRTGIYANTNNSDTLIERVILQSPTDLRTLDLVNDCLEYFDEDNLTKPARLWWDRAKLNANFKKNEAACRRIVRVIHDLDDNYKYFDYEAYRSVIAKYNIRFIPDFADPLLPLDSRALASFENYLRGCFYSIISQNKILDQIKDPRELGKVLITLPEEYIRDFSLKNRVRALRTLASGKLIGELSLSKSYYDQTQEAIGFSFIKNTPENQIVELLDSLAVNSPCYDHPSLMAALCADVVGFDGEYYAEFIRIVMVWTKKYKPKPDNFSITTAIDNQRYFSLDNGAMTADLMDYSFDPDGKIHLFTRRSWSNFKQEFRLLPYEWVYIKFLGDFEFGSTTFPENSVGAFPAIFAYAIFTAERNKRLVKSAKLSMDIALFAIGVGEVRLAIAAGAGAWNTWNKVKSVVEIGLSLPDIIISNGLGEELEKSVAGRNFMEHWNTVQLYYGIGSLTESGLSSIVRKIYKDRNELRALDNISTANMQEVDEIISNLKLKTGITETGDLLSSFGRVSRGVPNLLKLDPPVAQFRQLIGKDGKYHRAADFWKDEGALIEHYLTKDGRYYIKHDPTNGRTLFIDADKQEFIGFHLDDDKVFTGDYESLATSFRTVHGLPGGLQKITVGNVEIALASDKFNVILGRFDLSQIKGFENEIGTKQVIEQMQILKNYSYASKNYELAPGALHILNIPEGLSEYYKGKGTEFWEAFNKAFLDMAIANKDRANVIIVTDLKKNYVLNNYNYIEKGFDNRASILAREIKYLSTNGITRAVGLNGEKIYIDEIELSQLIFSE